MASQCSERMSLYLNGEMSEREADEFEVWLIEFGTDEDFAWVLADAALKDNVAAAFCAHVLATGGEA